jgi:molybdopterin-containing oxidoreductase family iron-sulfur binding subunit
MSARDAVTATLQAARRGLDRREALRLLAAHIALSLGACERPVERIVPYVRMPEQVVPGEPLQFATALPLAGFGRGVIVRSIDGRPVKISGNPRHPASLGSTDVFAEASVLSLYDPDRSQTILKDGAIASLDGLRTALAPRLRRMRDRGGEGVRILTGRITSPTLAGQLAALLDQHPRLIWHAYEPTDDLAAGEGAHLAFGRPVSVLPQLEQALTILTLDADPLGPGPDQIRNGRGYGVHRATANGEVSRLYAIEAAPTLTGAKADHRLALPPALIAEAAVAVARGLGADLREATLPEEARGFAAAALAALQQSRGRAIVLAGRTLPPETHALVHWINARLAAPVRVIEPVDRVGTREAASLNDLVRDLDQGAVETLVMIGCNPAYDAPGAIDIVPKLRRAAFRLHLGHYADETAAAASWHMPQSHPLESWSDIRATCGTASIVQPLIRPLYASYTAHDLLATMSGAADPSYDLVRKTWSKDKGEDFERWWTATLHDGVVADSAAPPAKVGEPALPSLPPPAEPTGPALVLRPDPAVWDGTHANNAWLQETPRPITRQVWGNALGLSMADAAALGVESGDVVRVGTGARAIDVPALVEPGHARGVASLTLGYGRIRAGAIGNGVGVDTFLLRQTGADWVFDRVTLEKVERREEVLTTQRKVSEEARVAEMFPVLTAAALAEGQGLHAASGPLPSLLPDRPADPAPTEGAPSAWAMVIDTALCIGCNACVVACQAENNVPVVGPEEVARGREMQWLRIDVYDHGTPEHPKPGFQPVPCMHCEKAPCEPVCPVAASVHDGEGLNVQVYNRCIGTRFCQANCPYKVRRFNFFGYADGQEYANLGLDPYPAQRNPEVTVRARGVMEKCTYCIQRISAARRAAARDGVATPTDAVTTACQDACPTRAIVFGDLKQEAAAVNRLKRDPRHYALLGHLGTQPRTTYLAELRNPDPKLEGNA